MGSKSVALFLVMLNSNQPWIEKLYYDNILFPKKKENKQEADSKFTLKRKCSERYSHSAKLPIKGIPIPSLE